MARTDAKENKPERRPFDPKVVELTVIGWALRYPERGYEIEAIRPAHFADPTRRKVFGVLQQLYADAGSAGITTATLVPACARLGVPEEQVFGVVSEAINDYAPDNPGSIGVVRDELLNESMRRSLLDAATKIKEAADSAAQSDDMANAASEIVEEAIRHNVAIEVASFAEQMEKEIKRVENLEAGVLDIGYSTGFRALDNMTGGMRGGEVWVGAGRPGMGKSSWLNVLAKSLSHDQQMPGVIFSMEMRAQDWAQRLCCNLAGVDIKACRLNALGETERRRYLEWARRIKSMPLFIQDSAGLTMPKVIGLARRLAYEHGIKWIGIDYLQLINHAQRRNESTNDAITRTSTQIKTLALSLDVPIILLSQLNRDCERREDKRPMLSDLRSSGSIEQDADVVMCIYRDAFYWTDEQKQDRNLGPTEQAEFLIRKQRNGPVGTVRVCFDRRCAKFEDYPDGEQPYPGID